MSPPPQRLGFAPAPIILDLKEIVDLFRALIERDDKQTELARSRLNQYASSPVQLNSASVTKEDLSELLSQSALIPEQYLSLVLNLLLFRNEPEIVDFGADKLKTESDRAAFYADLFFRRSSREARHTNISTYSKHTELLLELCKDSENPQAISAALLLLKLDLNQFLEPVLKQACTWQRNSKRYLLDALAGAQLSSQISKENSLALEQMLVSAVDELMTRTHLPRQETYWYENIALLIYFLDSGDAKLHCSRQLLLLNGPFPNLWQHRNYLNVLAHTVDDPESVWKLLCRAFPEYDSAIKLHSLRAFRAFLKHSKEMQQEQYFDLCQSFIVNLLSSERDSNVIRECLKVIKDLNLSHEIVKAAVMEALKNRQLAGSRELAVETLMHIAMEDPRTLDSLKQVANDSNRAVRLEAREALRKLDPQYAAGLAQIPDIDSDPLAFLTDDDPQVLAQALTRFAYKFVPSQDYLDENADKVDLLIELLHRPYTARCLAQFGHRAERAIVPLLNLLETAPDQTTAQAIGKLAATSSSGKKLLQEKFLCENFAASWASSRILAELAPEDCLQLLRPALDSQSSTVLFYALKQICDLKLKEDFLLPLIMEMIDNEQLNSPEISILVGPCTITEQMTPRTLMVEILAFYFDTEGVSEKISTLRLDPNLLVMAKASKVYEYGSNSQNLRAVQWNVPKLRAEGNEPRSAPPPPRPPSAPDDPGGS